MLMMSPVVKALLELIIRVESPMKNLFLLSALLASGIAAQAQNTPLEIRASLMKVTPKIDGTIEDAEWRGATRVDGFAWNGQLEKRRAIGFVGATETTLYFAVRTQLPTQGELVKETARDTENLVYDDSLEMWLDATPGAERGKRFQVLANALGNAWGKLHPYGGVADEPGWHPDWQRATTTHDGVWDYEIAIPIESIAPNRKATDGVWGFNLTRNWKNDWAFSSLTGDSYQPQARITFAKENAPIVQEFARGDAFNTQVDNALRLYNPGTTPLALKATLQIQRDVMPELKREENITLAPGETKEISLKTEDAATKKWKQTARVTSPGGETLYFARNTAWSFTGPWQWIAKTKEIPPLDFQFAYYPTTNRMRILADASNLPKNARLQSLRAIISGANSNEAIKAIAFDKLQNGKQELEFSLPPLNGQYRISMSAIGENVPNAPLVKTFERKVFPWENNPMGRSTKVYAPFTPIIVKGSKISTVLREHEMNGAGLWTQVTATGTPLLAAPMRYEVTIGGAKSALKAGSLSWTKSAPNEARARGGFSAGALRADTVCVWDYDGMMRVDLTLQPCVAPVENFDLIIPLRGDQATMLHAMGDGIRNTIYKKIPTGDGVVWTAGETQANDLPKNFCTYIFAGNAKRGLCWFAENDKGWSWDGKAPNLDLFRANGQLLLRVHLINQPTKIEAPRTITFGLQAAPVKPKYADWRHKWRRDNYNLLGTDINWLALGDCGSVYPAGRDLSLWESIAKGNKAPLSETETNAVIERGKPYFAPYGPEKVNTFVAHARHNTQSHLGAKMVFYYNRASYQDAEEFETFKDEWGLSDYRTVGKGNGIWEIKIVPTQSYIDHALYWYAKSFEVGANQGVYWDNWFFNGTYNTAMTGAYHKPDGGVVPSTGIWGLRELCKRTFQMMNERGMPPITMPHMTSTSILPMLGFATVQYDWEWKYSEGDVQDRFPREYLLLASDGELAGTWPVILGDQGKLAEDMWTARTFAAVAMLHELDCAYPGYSKTGQMQRALFKPIDALLGQPNLQVFRYWDEREQPIKTDNPDLPAIVYALPSRQAIASVVSYADSDKTARVTIDANALGFKDYTVSDAESGAVLPVENNTISFPLKKHDLKMLKVVAK